MTEGPHFPEGSNQVLADCVFAVVIAVWTGLLIWVVFCEPVVGGPDRP